MHVISARNVNDAYRRGLQLLSEFGEPEDSRNGPVLRVSAPVVTIYSHPEERVLFDVQRNANPFFHLIEALWMLNGSNDVATLAPFLPRIAQFSDDGISFHGAYGHRWRHWPDPLLPHPFDQLATVIDILRRDPTSRRAVISMWDPARDLDADSKDIPCNDLIFCRIVDHALHITVCNRSNDAIWGCYGANAVHLSILHEYLAAMIGIRMGTYTQLSNDFHAYRDVPYRFDSYYPLQIEDSVFTDPYHDATLRAHPLILNADIFDRELRAVMQAITVQQIDSLNPELFYNRFFPLVVIPMVRAHEAIRGQDYERALYVLASAQSAHSVNNDWLTAAEQWTMRRFESHPALRLNRSGALFAT